MLQLYRTRRAGLYNRLARASENGGDRVDERTEQFVPRTLTQNFMNNAGSGSAHNSFSLLSNSNLRQSAINRRSENFRRNFDTIDELVNHLRNQRGNEDTQTLPENAQNVENFEVASGNHSNGNNFDRIATFINPPESRLLRRPVTRAAGFDSRQPISLPLNSSSNQ
jgi:hypothetical protein